MAESLGINRQSCAQLANLELQLQTSSVSARENAGSATKVPLDESMEDSKGAVRICFICSENWEMSHRGMRCQF